MAIQTATFKFLNDLEANNNREWFQENKDRYEKAQADVKSFAADFFKSWAKVEDYPPQDPAKSLFRIYRDVRFSKNKSPYKAWLSLELKRNPGCMGLYIHLQPGNKSLVGTGIWEASPEQLAAARQEIDYNAAALRKLLSAKKLVDVWGEMKGDALKTAPKGYAKDDPNIDLLRYKQFMVMRYYKDTEVRSEGFVKTVTDHLKVARPFMDFFDAPMKELLHKAT
jgi:uncharacterized protein (TIGR02453 family)